MRLFIAFDVDSEEVERLRKIFSISGVKLAEGNHLTLKFLGDVDEALVPKIQEALRPVRFERIDVRLDGLGTFPNTNFIRVVWVGLKPEEKILELKKKIDEALLHYFPEDKDFKVHVTIGRVKDISVKDTVLRKLKERVKPEKITLDSFKLYRSELERKGPNYSAIEEYDTL